MISAFILASKDESPSALATNSLESAALLERTYPANASSFSVSTWLIKVTISPNESLSASEASKIASILAFSVETAASLAAFSVDTSASILAPKDTSAASPAAFSVDTSAAILASKELSAAVLKLASFIAALSIAANWATRPSMSPCTKPDGSNSCAPVRIKSDCLFNTIFVFGIIIYFKIIVIM